MSPVAFFNVKNGCKCLILRSRSRINSWNSQYLRRHGIRITFPRKQNEHRTGPFDRALYRLRERVERLINRLKHHRRLATRYEKCAVNYHAMWLIAATLLWL